MILWRRFMNLFRRGRLDRELREEMQLHIELRAEQLRRSGLQDAQTAARKTFGNILRVREEARDMWGWNFLDTFIQDLRYAARQLRKAPGFAAVLGSMTAGRTP